MIDNLYHLARADQQLTLGMKVAVRWSENGYSCRGQGEITKLEKFSVTVHVHLQQDKSSVKKVLQLPRFADQTRWSQRNCVMPV